MSATSNARQLSSSNRRTTNAVVDKYSLLCQTLGLCRGDQPHSSSLPIITPITRTATRYTAAGMTKPWTAAGTEAAAIFVCDGVDETVSDKASLRSLTPSV